MMLAEIEEGRLTAGTILSRQCGCSAADNRRDPNPDAQGIIFEAIRYIDIIEIVKVIVAIEPVLLSTRGEIP